MEGQTWGEIKQRPDATKHCITSYNPGVGNPGGAKIFRLERENWLFLPSNLTVAKANLKSKSDRSKTVAEANLYPTVQINRRPAEYTVRREIITYCCRQMPTHIAKPDENLERI